MRGIAKFQDAGLYFCLLLIASCSQQPMEIQKESQIKQSNVVKVLDRITCNNIFDSCSGEIGKIIWDACLRDGFAESMPEGNVISSRDLRELTKGFITVKHSQPMVREETDENGIVTTTKVAPKEWETQSAVSGYCIGSEYIMRS